MYFLDPRALSRDEPIVLKNRTENGTFRLSKAYAQSENAEFVLFVPQTLGVYAPVLSVFCDGGEKRARLAFQKEKCENGVETYRLSFSVSALITDTDLNPRPDGGNARGTGLLFFTVLFSSGNDVFALSSVNNVDGVLTDDENAAQLFKMLVYEDGFETPDWYKDAVMYHIFVDRFYKGSVPVPKKENAVLNEDWENGVPQYGEKPGDFCANNMFFGGTLYGIAEKLDYLESLAVNLLYLSPIFDAYSNHKYDTGNYGAVDAMFGGEEGLRTLLCACRERNIRVILDGVFNHTGDDSLYFNRYGRYPSVGAYQAESSPYHDWFTFRRFPNDYECWWGITILPKLNLHNPQVEEYLVGKDGIVAKYLREGIAGYRLDVADELPPHFLEKLRKTVKTEKSDGVVLGEVWENAADKIAYGQRRAYFCGKQLDGVMNYPVKDAIVRFVKEGDARALYDTVSDIYSSYPSFVSLTLMNLLGTHDTERILTVLGTERHHGLSNRALSHFRLNEEEYRAGKQKLLCASVLQFTLPGTPSVFYGDEAGVQGGHDPFCRATFPWGREDEELLAHYRLLGHIRRTCRALCRGGLSVKHAENGVFVFERILPDETVTVAVNCGKDDFLLTLEDDATELLRKEDLSAGDDFLLSPFFCAIFLSKKSANAKENG